jgi:putative membrane protein
VRDRFGLARNHYDRLVHFAFGLLLTYPVRELAQRLLRVRRVWAYVLPFLVTLSLSAGYESIESWVARIVSPELGAAYLGTQGDEWDAQKDMDHAMSGALICLAFVWLRERLRGPAPRPQRS